MAEYESSDKENMDEETALGHAAVKRARTMHAQRPLSHGRDNECRPVGLGLKQKKPASAPDLFVLKGVSSMLEQPDYSNDDAVS